MEQLIEKLRAELARIPTVRANRSKELYSLYDKIVTEKNQEGLIERFEERESEEQYKFRIRVTKPKTKAIIGQVCRVISRIEGVKPSIDLNGIDERVKDNISNFHGNLSLSRYLFKVMREANTHDPNSFLYVGFEDMEQGGALQMRKARPEVIPHNEVYSFRETEKGLEWLIRKQEPLGDDNKSYLEFTIYSKGLTVVATETRKRNLVDVDYVVMNHMNKDITFELKSYDTGALLPVVPLGYIQDPCNKETKVSIYDDAVGYVREFIDLNSEVALLHIIHLYLQKVQAVEDCDYSDMHNGICQGGTLSTGGTCPSCKGTGKKIATNTLEAITVNISDDQNIALKPSEIVHYVNMPTEIIRIKEEKLNELPYIIEGVVFGAVTSKLPTTTTTATENTNKYESVYSVLSEYGRHFSHVYETIVRLLAEYNDVSDVEVRHSFPRDFKMVSLNELLSSRKLAIDSGAPHQVVTSIDRDIIAIQHRDDSSAIDWAMFAEKWKPFRSKSQEDLSMALSQLPTGHPKRVLWLCYDEVMTELRETKPMIYLSDYETQKNAIGEIVQRMSGDISGGDILRSNLDEVA